MFIIPNLQPSWHRSKQADWLMIEDALSRQHTGDLRSPAFFFVDLRSSFHTVKCPVDSLGLFRKYAAPFLECLLSTSACNCTFTLFLQSNYFCFGCARVSCFNGVFSQLDPLLRF